MFFFGNKCFSAGLTKDVGLTYTPSTDSEGTEIAYNVLDGNATVFGVGVYLDEGSLTDTGARNHMVHHNLIRNVRSVGVTLANVNHVYNNTVVNAGRQTAAGHPSLLEPNVDLSASKIFNNVGHDTFLSVILSSGSSRWIRVIPAYGDWTEVNVPFADFRSPDSGPPVGPIALNSVDSLALESDSIGEFSLWFDNVALVGNAGTELVDDFDDGDLVADITDTSWWAGGGEVRRNVCGLRRGGTPSSRWSRKPTEGMSPTLPSTAPMRGGRYSASTLRRWT